MTLVALHADRTADGLAGKGALARFAFALVNEVALAGLRVDGGHHHDVVLFGRTSAGATRLTEQIDGVRLADRRRGARLRSTTHQRQTHQHRSHAPTVTPPGVSGNTPLRGACPANEVA